MPIDYDGCGNRYDTADIPLYWTVSGSVSVSTFSPRIAGGAFLRMPGAGVYVQKTFSGGAAATVYLGFALRIAATPGGPDVLLYLLDGGSTQMALRLNTDLTLSVLRGATVLATTSTTLSTGVWYYLEFGVTIHSSTGAYALRLNGTDILTPATNQNTQATGNASVTSARIYNPGVGNMDVDDYYAIDPANSDYGGFLGDVTAEYIPPTGAGNSTQWSPQGAVSNYQCVDETASNGDTDFCSTSTSGQKDTFALQNLSVTPQSIIAVKPILVARKDDTGTANVRTVIRSGGTDYNGNYVGLALTYAPIDTVYETDPATSAAWTPSGVNALEAGYQLQ